MVRTSISIRVGEELETILKDIAKKNNISITEASRELARMSEIKIRGLTNKKEIIF